MNIEHRIQRADGSWKRSGRDERWAGIERTTRPRTSFGTARLGRARVHARRIGSEASGASSRKVGIRTRSAR